MLLRTDQYVTNATEKMGQKNAKNDAPAANKLPPNLNKFTN